MLKNIKQQKSLVDEIVDGIIELIQKSEINTGDKIPNELELCKLLGVGRNTIREAIKILVSKNILIIKRGNGTFVSDNIGIVEDPLGFKFIADKNRLANDILEIRLILEPKIAEYAATNATDEQIKEIEIACKNVEELILKGEPHMEEDIYFHTKIAQSSGNLVISTLLPIINNSIELCINITKSILKEETIKTHNEILDAIKQKDGQKAYDAMKNHLEYNKFIIKNR